ncbi:hypothetical protein BCR42DRAFT_402344 [Absidia repens]|uniref:HTH La-type RNA-binding domain-containing protein n=1 Tax=Absidia repens TaxID=90262 RepID=A0A1X2IXW2_9FUNG|nr:hypothetical protein BCR42DRAFT_402344 [Absidia repens]
MTTFSSSQNQSQQKKQYQASIGATMVNNTQLNQQQHSSKGFTIQRPSLGLHQNGSLSTLESPYYTTSRQNNLRTASATASSTSSVSESGHTCSDTGATGEPGMTDDDNLEDEEDDYDEDDVEIIMHEGNESLNPSNSGLDNDSAPINSSPAAAAPCQQYRQQPSSDHDHQPLQDSTHHPLQRQLEYYFSRQNLANDTYLVSQMDPELYVPIATIAKFKRVQDITSDMDYIVLTLRRSLVVTVDESGTKVKPNISLQRTTVILRELPDASEKEIKIFLQDMDSPPVKSIKNEYGNMWYITFDSEDDALKVLYGTRGRSFKGQPVAARMKSEPVVGSIQARKSALQAETSSSSTANATHVGPDQHSSTVDIGNTMKKSHYNGYYYTYNSPAAFRNQYPPVYTNHHSGNSYHYYSSNGGQRTGNRRSTRGGRGRHTNNSGNGYGGIGRNNPTSAISTTTIASSTDGSPSPSFVSYTNADRSWTQRYNWQTAPKSQRYRQTRSTPPNEQPCITGTINETHDGTSTDLSPPSSSPSLSSHSSQYPVNHKRHSYHQSSSYYRGQKNGKSHQASTQWQQRRYNNSSTTNLTYYHTALDSNGSPVYIARTHPNRPTHYQESSQQVNIPSSALLNSPPSSSPPDVKINSTPTTASSTYRKSSITPCSSSSSENTQTATTTTAKTTAPITNEHSSPSAPTPTTSKSTPAREDRKNHNDGKTKRKSKWDKKRKTRKSSGTTSTTTDNKPQEHPDLQSGTYFPPLPGAKDSVGDIAAKTRVPPPPSVNTVMATEVAMEADTGRSNEMTVSDLLEERLSAAEIVKKGHDSTLKKTPSMPLMNGSSVINAATPTTSNSSKTSQQKQPAKGTLPTDTPPTIKKNARQETTPGNQEPFPLLCPVQDSPLTSTNFSYADMLKKKENGTS